MSCCETDACNVPSSGHIVALGKSVFVLALRALEQFLDLQSEDRLNCI